MDKTAAPAEVAERLPSELLTFLIADVRGYTRFTADHGDDAAARLATRFADIAEKVVARHAGKVLELRGDEALAVFPSARDALRASVALQHSFREVMEHEPSLPLQVGMGLDAGEAIPVRGGYRGGALNLAARLCSLAGPGEVFCSETVTGLAHKTDGIAFIDRGEVALKGLTSPVHVIQIAPDGDLPQDLAPLQPLLVTQPTNLPDDPTPFIGREKEVHAISELVQQPEVRLVTLTGPGGIGKTRLALQVANTLLSFYPDGVFFVSLASLADAALVPSAIATALTVKEEGGNDLVSTLAGYLEAKHLLLVLDNAEHLPDASPVVATLLDTCRELRVLATARIPLHLIREHQFPIPPLSMPDPLHLPHPSALAQYDAVALFVERAGAVAPGFAITHENAASVAEICYRLDGLPLAIELAAARVKLFPPQALLGRLSSRLKLLTGGAKDRPTRQQTLRGTIDWSYSLLVDHEQALFARLSVFAGGCTFEAAEAVCNPTGDIDSLEGMASLVDKSLLWRTGDDEPRFTMLETIREYAAEELAKWYDVEDIQQAHADYYLQLAEEAEKRLRGREQMRWLDRLEAEHDNIRTALIWLLERRRTEQALRLAGALRLFWHAHSHFSEGRRWLDAGLSDGDAVVASVRSKALAAAATLAMIQGDQEHAIALADVLLAVAREQVDRPTMNHALTILGMTAVQRGDYRQAFNYLEESLSLARTVGTPLGVAQSLYNLGLAKSEEGAYAEALTLIQEARALFQDMAEMFWYMNTVGSLGYIALLEGRYAQGRPFLEEYLDLARRFQDKSNIAAGLEGLGALAAQEGKAERAALVFASAAHLRKETRSQLMSLRNRTTVERHVSSARQHLGEELWNRAWREGQAMTMAEAIAYALDEGQT